MSKDPIHVLYKELFQIGKRFDQYPVLRLYAKESSKKLNRIRSLNEPFTPLLYQRFISEKSNNWVHSSEDFELFREFSFSLKYAETKVKWFVDVPTTPLPIPTVDIIDIKNIKEGNILVAHPSLENTNYQQAVTLILAVSAQEIVGITLNKPSHKNVYDGGPVKNYTAYDTKLIALFSKENTFKDGMKIAHNLYYVILKKKELEGVNPSDYVLFFGTMRWGRSQLKNEIDNDSWILLDCPLEHVYKPVSNSYTETWKKDENGNDYLLIENLSKHGQDVYDTEINRQQALFKQHFSNNEVKLKNETNNNNNNNENLQENPDVDIKTNTNESLNKDQEKIKIENIKENENNNKNEINEKQESRVERSQNDSEIINENINLNNNDDDENDYDNDEISEEGEENYLEIMNENKKINNELKLDSLPPQEENEKIEDWVNRILLIESLSIGNKIKQLKSINSKLKFKRLKEMFQEKEEKERDEGERVLKVIGWAHPKILWNHLLTLIGGEISLGIYCFEKPKLQKENATIETLENQLEIIQKDLLKLKEESQKLLKETEELRGNNDPNSTKE